MPEYCYTVKNAEQSDFLKRKIQGGIKHPLFLLFLPFLFVLLLFHSGIIGPMKELIWNSMSRCHLKHLSYQCLKTVSYY